MTTATTQNRVIWLVAAVLVFVLIAARFVNIAADPPLHYARLSQSMLTDPYHLTFAARNAVLFDDWHPFDLHRWDVFKNSIVSGVAYLWFVSFGVSKITANLASLTLHFGGLVLFVLGLMRWRPRTEIIATVLFLLINSHLFFYGRLPFLENGLIFFAGLIFFVAVGMPAGKTWAFVCGVLVALAALAGKLFGVLLLAPVVSAIWIRTRTKGWAATLLVLAGLIAGSVAYAFVFYGGDIATMRSYYLEQTVGLYGLPSGLRSIDGFLTNFVTYGIEVGLWEFSPYILVLVSLGLIFGIVELLGGRERFGSRIALLFCIIWFAAGIVSLMVFGYRPIRYALFLLLPASALAGYFVTNARRVLRDSKTNMWMIPPIFLVSWYVFTQIVLFTYPDSQQFAMGREIKLWTALASVGITVCLILLFNYGKALSSRPLVINGAIGLLLVGVLVRQVPQIANGLTESGDSLRDYNREMEYILPSEAVLTGAFVPALTIENQLSGVIHSFGLRNQETNFFDKYGITHVVASSQGWDLATKKYPDVAGSQLVAQMAVRDQIVEVYRLPWCQLARTDYERAMLALSSGDWQSALGDLRIYLRQHPRSLLGNLQFAMANYAGTRYDECVDALDSIGHWYPNNYMVHEFCSEFFVRIFRRTGDRRFKERAEYHQRRVLLLNPYSPEAGREGH